MHQEKKVISKKSIIIIKHTAVGFKVNTKDFDFVFRKEFLILCLLLLTVTFAQVSLGQMSGMIKSEPFLILNFTLFEVLGVILPVFSGMYIYLNYRTKNNHPWFLFIVSVGVIVLATLIIAALFGVSFRSAEDEGEVEPVLPSYNTTSIITTTPYTIITTETQQTTEPTQLIAPPVNLLDLNDFFQSLQNFGIFFLIFLFFIPLLFMFIIRRWSEDMGIDSEDTKDVSKNRYENQYKMRTVLECYYQASTALEERGADSSLNFTPTEFSQDVVNKTLTSPPLIDDLTDVFEEVKFSDHTISDQQVNLAKSLASKIIFSSDSMDENEIDEETED